MRCTCEWTAHEHTVAPPLVAAAAADVPAEMAAHVGELVGGMLEATSLASDLWVTNFADTGVADRWLEHARLCRQKRSEAGGEEPARVDPSQPHPA